jgi:hypothetical protein
MKRSRNARIVLIGAAALIVALVSIGWWLGSPGNVTKAGQAIVMLAGAICSIEHCRRFPKGSPLVLCGAVVGLGVPYIAANVGPLIPIVLAVAVVIAWTGIAIARSRPPSYTGLRRARARDGRTVARIPQTHAGGELVTGER